jgi:beta-RFAP synthase
MSVTVRTPGRLHFGLFCPGEPAAPGRRFGGVGLMVERPGVWVMVTEAPAWSADGPSADRAMAFARRFLQSLPADRVYPPQRVAVEQCPREHTGLGTGTQLGLAVARALAGAYGVELPAAELARRVGRGRRSALGIHGFRAGGFLVEAGHGDREAVAPLVVRTDFPEAWRIVLILPQAGQGLHGPPEMDAFRELSPEAAARTDALCRLVLLGMLPALVEGDCRTFGEALYDYNRRAGEFFRAAQGGIYGDATAARQIAFLRRQGAAGVGQSSWGPAVFAVVEDAERAADLARRLRQEFALAEGEVIATPACNRGAEVLEEKTGPG